MATHSDEKKEQQVNELQAEVTAAHRKVATKEQELESAGQKDIIEREYDLNTPTKENELQQAKQEELSKEADLESAKNDIAQGFNSEDQKKLQEISQSMQKDNIEHDAASSQEHEVTISQMEHDSDWKTIENRETELNRAKEFGSIETEISQPENVSKDELGTMNSPLTPHANKEFDYSSINVANKYGQPVDKDQTLDKEPEQPEK